MTNKSALAKTHKPNIEPKKKLSRKEREEAFRQMNENWAKGMDIYLAALEGQKEEEQSD